MIDTDNKRKARSEFVFKQKTLSLIAMSCGVSANTVSRWKRAAKDMGDDWDVARAAHMIAGAGLDAVIMTVVEEFMMMAQSAIEELKADARKSKDEQMPIANRITMMTSLADAMTKMTASAGKLAPKVSELGVAQAVVQQLLEFVREHYPQHSNAILEIIEPFGGVLTRHFAP